MKKLRIATFNVNGMRARLPNFSAWLEREKPDIAWVQELKSLDSAFPAAELESAGYGRTALHLLGLFSPALAEELGVAH